MRRGLSFAIAIFVILAIIVLAHAAVYEAFVHFWNITGRNALKEVRITFGILAISFVGLSVITMPKYTKLGSFLYALSAVWLGTLFWLFLASVIGAVLFLFGAPAIAGQGLFVLAIAVSFGGIINSNMTRVVRYDVSLPNLPESWRGKRVALVSDTHLGNVRGLSFAKKIVRMVNREEPELVIIAGDFFDGPEAPFVKFAAPLAGLAAPKGAYFAEGNHEEMSKGEKYRDAIRAAGVNVLVNEKTEVDGIEIIGINYDISNGDAPTRELLERIGVRRDMPSILIKHAPTGINAASDSGVDLMVSGHTHRGQIWPGPLLTKRIFKEFEYGMHKKGPMTAITSSGAGTWGPPQRIGTHCEIVVITLQ